MPTVKSPQHVVISVLINLLILNFHSILPFMAYKRCSLYIGYMSIKL